MEENNLVLEAIYHQLNPKRRIIFHLYHENRGKQEVQISQVFSHHLVLLHTISLGYLAPIKNKVL